MSRRVAFRGKRQNRLGMFLVSVVVVMLLVVVSVNSFLLKQKQDTYKEREAELDELIAAEEQRTTELEELRKYTQTQAYIEEVAKQKLGLVKPDEILLKPIPKN